MDRIDPPADDLVAAFEAAATVEERLAVLRSRYRVEPVPADHAFEDDAVYFVVGGRKNYLIRTLSPAIADGHLHFQAWPGGTPMQPLACERLAAAVALQRILQLHPKPADMAERDRILDVGGFSQLVEAAQRSGLVPGVATIIQVRDCEFRLGKHAQALQLMESLLQAFVVKAGQRAQQLAREDQEIASGRLKISPRELQAKRSRDRQQTRSGPIRKILTHLGEPLEPPPVSPARGPPADWRELVQVHDDRAIFQASPDELPVIDIRSL